MDERIAKRELATANLRFFSVLFLLLFEIGAFVAVLAGYYLGDEIGSKRYEIAVVDLNEPITVEYAHRIESVLSEYAKKENIKEFLILFNSPGGSPAASWEIATFLRSLSGRKPVTAYVDSMAVSGSYYVAAALGTIYANRNAMVGSIGVVLPHWSFEGLAKKAGVRDDSVTAGKYKRPISPLRDVDEESEKYVRDHLLEPTYRNFLKDVASWRGISVDDMGKRAEGKIYIASDGRAKGVLVDEIKPLHELKRELASKYPEEKFRFVTVNLAKREFPLPLRIEVNAGDLFAGIR